MHLSLFFSLYFFLDFRSSFYCVLSTMEPQKNLLQTTVLVFLSSFDQMFHLNICFFFLSLLIINTVIILLFFLSGDCFNSQPNMRIGKWEMIQMNISIDIGIIIDITTWLRLHGLFLVFLFFIFICFLNKLDGLGISRSFGIRKHYYFMRTFCYMLHSFCLLIH